jgi:hypothetical protein
MDQKEPDYDNMTEEEYVAEMEKKVEYYKKAYPDMYEKAQQWMQMLEHSEVYKKETNDEGKQNESQEWIQANDILKNMNFNGFKEEDMSEKEIDDLNKGIPDWRTKLVE